VLAARVTAAGLVVLLVAAGTAQARTLIYTQAPDEGFKPKPATLGYTATPFVSGFTVTARRLEWRRWGDASARATGDEHRVRIDLPNGFEYKQAEVGNTVMATASSDDPLSFSFEKSYAQLNRFDWSPAAAA
jgi:hypothetical protein